MKHSALQSSARLSPSLPECGRNDPAICLGEDEGSPISRVSGPRVNLWWSHTYIHVHGIPMYMVWPLPIPSYELYCIDYSIMVWSACSIWSQMLFVTHAASVMIGLLPPWAPWCHVQVLGLHGFLTWLYYGWNSACICYGPWTPWSCTPSENRWSVVVGCFQTWVWWCWLRASGRHLYILVSPPMPGHPVWIM